MLEWVLLLNAARALTAGIRGIQHLVPQTRGES